MVDAGLPGRLCLTILFLGQRSEFYFKMSTSRNYIIIINGFILHF